MNPDYFTKSHAHSPEDIVEHFQPPQGWIIGRVPMDFIHPPGGSIVLITPSKHQFFVTDYACKECAAAGNLLPAFAELAERLNERCVELKTALLRK